MIPSLVKHFSARGHVNKIHSFIILYIWNFQSPALGPAEAWPVYCRDSIHVYGLACLTIICCTA